MTFPCEPATQANSNNNLLLNDIKQFEKYRKGEQAKLYFPEDDRTFFVQGMSRLLVAADVNEAEEQLRTLGTFFSQNINVSLVDPAASKTSERIVNYKVVRITIGNNTHVTYHHLKPDYITEDARCIGLFLKRIRMLIGTYQNTDTARTSSIDGSHENDAKAMGSIKASENMVLFRLLINHPKNMVCNYTQFEKLFAGFTLKLGSEQEIVQLLETLCGASETETETEKLERLRRELLNLSAAGSSLKAENPSKISAEAQQVSAVKNDKSNTLAPPEQKILSIDKIRPKGRPRAKTIEMIMALSQPSNGLKNLGNTCAFNASFQAISHSLLAILVDKSNALQLEHSRICNMLCNLKVKVNDLHCNPVILNKVQASILTSQIAANSDRNYQLEVKTTENNSVVDVKNQCETLNNFMSSFIEVCELAGKGICDSNRLKSFFKAYTEHAVSAQRQVSKNLLGVSSNDVWQEGSYRQVCAHEVITDLMDITALSSFHDCTLAQYETLRAYDKDECTHERVNEFPSAGIISIPVTGKNYDINQCLLQFQEEEDFHDWDFDYQQHNVARPTNKTKQMEWITQSNTIPKQLVLSLKLFDDQMNKIKVPKAYCGQNSSSDIGVLSLCQLYRNNFEIKVPIISKANTQPENILARYQVVAVVCHIGSILKSGHYITIKISDDAKQINICDDSKVMSLVEYKIKLTANRRYAVILNDDFSDICSKCGFSGYVYFLKRVSKSGDFLMQAKEA